MRWHVEIGPLKAQWNRYPGHGGHCVRQCRDVNLVPPNDKDGRAGVANRATPPLCRGGRRGHNAAMFDPQIRDQLQAACELGQEQLIATDYLSAAATLAGAEAIAWDAEDFDTLARLYMPLQEARRQARLRAGEGAVHLHLIATSAEHAIDPAAALVARPHGQLLVAGWGTTAPAAAVRRFAAEGHLYAETFLAAAYPGPTDQPLIAVVPFDASLPEPVPRPTDDLLDLLPPGSLVLHPADLPPVTARGTPETYAAVIAIWDRLHAPFLAEADAEPDPTKRMAAYRRTIAVDPGCEFAHQRLSITARELARQIARRG